MCVSKWLLIRWILRRINYCRFHLKVKCLTCYTAGRQSPVCLPPQIWSESAPRCSCFPCLFLNGWENKGEAFNHTIQILFMVSGGDREGGGELNRNAKGFAWTRRMGLGLSVFRGVWRRRKNKKIYWMCFLSDLVGIMWRRAGLLPVVFPNLTCSAESGMSQRNLNGSKSPWESAERELVWS